MRMPKMSSRRYLRSTSTAQQVELHWTESRRRERLQVWRIQRNKRIRGRSPEEGRAKNGSRRHGRLDQLRSRGDINRSRRGKDRAEPCRDGVDAAIGASTRQVWKAPFRENFHRLCRQTADFAFASRIMSGGLLAIRELSKILGTSSEVRSSCLLSLPSCSLQKGRQWKQSPCSIELFALDHDKVGKSMLIAFSLSQHTLLDTFLIFNLPGPR